MATKNKSHEDRLKALEEEVNNIREFLGVSDEHGAFDSMCLYGRLMGLEKGRELMCVDIRKLEAKVDDMDDRMPALDENSRFKIMLKIQELKNSCIFKFQEFIPGVFQIFAPFFHEDGDMVDVYIVVRDNSIRICDFGKTFQHMSYTCDVGALNNEILSKIISENCVNEKDGILFIDVGSEDLYSAILRFVIAVSKVSCMKYFKLDVVSDEMKKEDAGKHRCAAKKFKSARPGFQSQPIRHDGHDRD